MRGGGTTSWAWEYQGKYQDGTSSGWLTEEQVRDSFSSLQIDVFHALWEDYFGPDVAPRPAGSPSRGEREVATAEEALREFPVGTEIGRELFDEAGQTVLRRGRVCDFSDPYWRVEYPDGDWEELTRRELRQAIIEAARVPTPSSQDVDDLERDIRYGC